MPNFEAENWTRPDLLTLHVEADESESIVGSVKYVENEGLGLLHTMARWKDPIGGRCGHWQLFPVVEGKSSGQEVVIIWRIKVKCV